MKKLLRDEKGAALVYIIMVFTVLMIFVTFLFSFISSENKMSLYYQRKIQAYYVARSGAVVAEKAIMNMDDIELNTLNKELDEKENEVYVEIENLNFDSDKKIVKIQLIKKLNKGGKEELHIVSEGEAHEVVETVTKVLETQTKSKPTNKEKLDMPMYVYNDLSMNSSQAPDIEGDVVLISDKAKFRPKNLKSITVKVENRNYPTIHKEYIENLKDKFIKQGKTQTETNNKEIMESMYIKQENMVTFQGVNVNTTKGPIDILVKDLTLEGNALTIKGTQKVRLFVENKLVFKGNNLFVNKDGNSNQLEIYHYGSDDINLTDKDSNGNTFINANIYVESAKVLVSKVKMSGLLYAPESDIIFDKTANSSTYMYGVVADTVNMEYHPGPSIYKPKIGAEVPADELVKRTTGGGSGGTGGANESEDAWSYKEGYFK